MLCDTTAPVGFSSRSQLARIFSERWFLENVYCLACDAPSLGQTRANTQATDFICDSCLHRYELKSFLRRPMTRLPDGAYQSLIRRIEQKTVPTLMLLQRSADWHVERVSAVHSIFLSSNVIEQRRPLAASARRAGWVGCNIRLDRLPTEAEITIAEQGKAREANEVRRDFRRFLPMAELESQERGWVSLTLWTLRKLERADFSLNDFYKLEAIFAAEYPRNKNMRPKMRQQLQRLRDLGVLRFTGRGRYQLL